MRRRALVIALCAGCGGGFALTIEISADPHYASLQQDGAPVAKVVIEQSFDSLAQAQHTPILFRAEDGTGVHTFDLSRYLGCSGDNDPPSLEVSLMLTYSTTCLPLPRQDGTTLGICWEGSRCGGRTTVP